MIEWTKYVVVLLASIALIPLYNKLARKWDLVDVPGERSSHKSPTLRGIGIILPIVYAMAFFLFDELNPYLMGGLLLGAITGFMDDKFELSAWVRALLYAVSVSLFLYAIPDTNIYKNWHIISIFIIALGAVNAYNFMDGINGITILYTGVFILTIVLIIKWFKYEIPIQSLWICLVVCSVMGYLNVRTTASAFIGDVGSVFLGLFVIYWVVYLTTYTRSPVYLLLLLIYGVDSTLTIIERLIKKENIFAAHRLHLYQLLVNELKWSHLKVSLLYGLLQLMVNTVLFVSVRKHWNGTYTLAFVAIVAGIIYLVAKYLLVYPATRIAKAS